MPQRKTGFTFEGKPKKQYFPELPHKYKSDPFFEHIHKSLSRRSQNGIERHIKFQMKGGNYYAVFKRVEETRKIVARKTKKTSKGVDKRKKASAPKVLKSVKYVEVGRGKFYPKASEDSVLKKNTDAYRRAHLALWRKSIPAGTREDIIVRRKDGYYRLLVEKMAHGKYGVVRETRVKFSNK